VSEKTLLIRVEANGKLQTLQICIIKTAGGGRAVTVFYGMLLVALIIKLRKVEENYIYD
jgi:hypothetical protein